MAAAIFATHTGFGCNESPPHFILQRQQLYNDSSKKYIAQSQRLIPKENVHNLNSKICDSIS